MNVIRHHAEVFGDHLPAGYRHSSRGLTFGVSLQHDDASETGRPERGGEVDAHGRGRRQRSDGETEPVPEESSPPAAQEASAGRSFNTIVYQTLVPAYTVMFVFFIVNALSTLYQFWIHTELIDRMGVLENVINTNR
jgi:hypothetical protein